MSALVTRSFEVETSTSGRELVGLAFAWSRPARVSDDGRTTFLEAFDRSVGDHVGPTGLFVRHPLSPGAKTTAEPVGRVEYEATDEGLAFRAELFDTPLGNATLEMLNNGVLGRDVSVGFWHDRKENINGVVVHKSLRLIELSLLGASERGAHPEAEIHQIRHELITPRRNRLRRRLAVVQSPNSRVS